MLQYFLFIATLGAVVGLAYATFAANGLIERLIAVFPALMGALAHAAFQISTSIDLNFYDCNGNLFKGPTCPENEHLQVRLAFPLFNFGFYGYFVFLLAGCVSVVFYPMRWIDRRKL